MTNAIKKFFNIETAYQFEYNDLRCCVTILNVALIMIFGLRIAWLGLIIALVGVVKDLRTDRKISSLLMHGSSVILNLYFISLI